MCSPVHTAAPRVSGARGGARVRQVSRTGSYAAPWGNDRSVRSHTSTSEAVQTMVAWPVLWTGPGGRARQVRVAGW